MSSDIKNPFDGVFTPEEINSTLKEFASFEKPRVPSGYKIEYHGNEKVGKSHNALSWVQLRPENPLVSKECRAMLLKEVEFEVDGVVKREPMIPVGYPVYVWDLEGRIQKLQSKFQGHDIHYKNVFYPDPNRAMHYDPEKTITDLYKTLVSASQLTKGTLIIESGTLLQEMARKYIQYGLIKKDDKNAKKLGEFVDISPAQWGVRNDIHNFLLDQIVRLRCHVIITSRERVKWGMMDTGAADGKRHLGKMDEWEPKRYEMIPYAMDAELRLTQTGRYTEGGKSQWFLKVVSSAFANDEAVNISIESPSAVKFVNRFCLISHRREVEEIRASGEIEQINNDYFAKNPEIPDFYKQHPEMKPD